MVVTPHTLRRLLFSSFLTASFCGFVVTLLLVALHFYLSQAFLAFAVAVLFYLMSVAVIWLGVLGYGLVYRKHFYRQQSHSIAVLAQRLNQSELSDDGSLNSEFTGLLEHLKSERGEMWAQTQLLIQALDSADQGAWQWRVDARESFLDDHCAELLGLDINADQRYLETDWLNAIHEQDREPMKALFREARSGKKTELQAGFRVYRDDQVRHLAIRGSVTLDEGLCITGTVMDDTQRHNSDKEIRLLASIFENTVNAVVILDTDFRIVRVNRAFSEITGFNFLKASQWQDFFTLLDEPEKARDVFCQKLKTHPRWQADYSAVSAWNSDLSLQVSVNHVVELGENTDHYVAVIVDNTERQKVAQQLKVLANYDTLTKLANRSLFNDSLERSLARNQRSGAKLAIMFVDLDRFKQVNDLYGHSAGDQLLVNVATLLLQCVRSSDLVARLAGDEFVILLEDVRDNASVTIVVKKILEAIAEGVKISDTQVSIGASIGIALSPDDAQSAGELMLAADAAMYSAKAMGRNNFQFYSDGMNALTSKRSRLEQELNNAYITDQLELYYQPKIDLASGRVLGFEALMRWFHPDMGPVSPLEFIAIAEESGLIKEIGAWAFEKACAQLAAWQQEGFSDLHMAVNVSARQFQLDDFPLFIAQSIEKYHLDSRSLEIELTESLIMDYPEKVVLMLRVIKQLGASIAIDDFGTGYSSLSYLHRFPIDTLKIDRAFISGIGMGDSSNGIVDAIIGMAHSLGLKVVAEGVETVGQLNYLKEHGCEQVQGYYFAKPLTAEKALIFLRENNSA